MTSEQIDHAKRVKLYRARRHRQGGEPLRMDASDVAKIVDKWAGFGFGSSAIGRAVGVTSSEIRSLRRGRVKRVDRQIALRVESLTAEDLYQAASDEDFVSAIGVTRRAQAVMVIGHPAIELIPLSKLAYMFLSGRRLSVHMNTHRKYAERYRELVLSPGSDVRARRRAAKLGYAGPLSWSAESIDDPWALPEIEADDAPATDLDLAEEVEIGLDMGMDLDWIARDRGVHAGALIKGLEMIGRSDLVERLRRRETQGRRTAS